MLNTKLLQHRCRPGKQTDEFPVEMDGADVATKTKTTSLKT